MRARLGEVRRVRGSGCSDEGDEDVSEWGLVRGQGDPLRRRSRTSVVGWVGAEREARWTYVGREAGQRIRERQLGGEGHVGCRVRMMEMGEIDWGSELGTCIESLSKNPGECGQLFNSPH